MGTARTCAHPERAARALLTHLARTTGRLLPALLAVMEPEEVLAAIRAGFLGVASTRSYRPLSRGDA